MSTPAITSVRATEAPVLEAVTGPVVESQGTGSIGRDGLQLSADARATQPEDNSLVAQGTRWARGRVQAIGQVFSELSDAIASAFSWGTMMMQIRSSERARERREEEAALQAASDARTAMNANQQKARDEARRG